MSLPILSLIRLELVAVALCAAALLPAAHPASGQQLPLEQVIPRDTIPVYIGYESVLRQQRGLIARPPTAADSAAAAEGLALDGLVIDETQTRIGRSFYDAFYQRWEAPEDARGFTVAVQERPLRGQGVLVSVKVNDELAFQARLQPRSDFETTARRAVAYAYRRLQETGARVIL